MRRSTSIRRTGTIDEDEEDDEDDKMTATSNKQRQRTRQDRIPHKDEHRGRDTGTVKTVINYDAEIRNDKYFTICRNRHKDSLTASQRQQQQRRRHKCFRRTETTTISTLTRSTTKMATYLMTTCTELHKEAYY
eukprot:2277522-Amphidinium_carterae.2